MSLVTPFDFLIAAVLGIRRFGFARTALAGFMLIPAFLWSLPPRPCSCIRPPFVRCKSGLRYHAAMKSDLKNLASQQEIYFSDHGMYSYDWQELGFVQSDGVEITIVASPDRWTALATHSALGEGEACAIYTGTIPIQEWDVVQPSQPGEIACTK